MEKIKKISAICLTFLLALCLSGCSSLAFFNRQIKKIPVECDKYNLEIINYAQKEKILDCKKFRNRGSGSEIKDGEVYNVDGIRILQKDSDDDSCEFTVYEQKQTWVFNQEFMNKSKTFVSCSSIWKKWNNGKMANYPTLIIGLYLSTEHEIFIITSSTEKSLTAHSKYPPTLWYFDKTQEKVLYCDYLKDDNGQPWMNDKVDLVITIN